MVRNANKANCNQKPSTANRDTKVRTIPLPQIPVSVSCAFSILLLFSRSANAPTKISQALSITFHNSASRISSAMTFCQRPCTSWIFSRIVAEGSSESFDERESGVGFRREGIEVGDEGRAVGLGRRASRRTEGEEK